MSHKAGTGVTQGRYRGQTRQVQVSHKAGTGVKQGQYSTTAHENTDSVY